MSEALPACIVRGGKALPPCGWADAHSQAAFLPLDIVVAHALLMSQSNTNKVTKQQVAHDSCGWEVQGQGAISGEGLHAVS